MPDVRMPDGTIIRNVPEGTTKADLLKRYEARGRSPSALADRYKGATNDQAFRAYWSGREKVASHKFESPEAKAAALRKYESDPRIKAIRQKMRDTDPVQGVLLGAMKPVDNLATWASNIPGVGSAVDRIGEALGMTPTKRAVAQNENAREANTRKGYQLAGKIAGTLPTAAIPGGAAVQGAVGGALLTDDPNDAKGTLVDALLGAVGGKAGEKVGKTISGWVGGGNVPKNVRLLADEGVVMTPGQRGGKVANFFEDKVLGSIPLVQDIPAAARSRAANDLRIAASNRVLKPIGASIERGTHIDNEAIGAIQDLVYQNYDDAIAPLAAQADNAFTQGIDDALLGADHQLGGDAAAQLGNYATYLKDRFAQPLGGDALKREVQTLRKVASETIKKDSLLGERFWALADVLDDAISRQSGAAASGQFSNARQSVSLLKRLSDAASRPGAVNGEFTPTHLLQAAKRKGFGTTADNIANGTAPLLDLANAGANVLRNTTANSGTVPRAIAGGAILSGAPAAVDPTLGVLTASSLARYIPGVDKILQEAALSRPEKMRAIGELLNRYSSVLVAPGAASAVTLSGN